MVVRRRSDDENTIQKTITKTTNTQHIKVLNNSQTEKALKFAELNMQYKQFIRQCHVRKAVNVAGIADLMECKLTAR